MTLCGLFVLGPYGDAFALDFRGNTLGILNAQIQHHLGWRTVSLFDWRHDIRCSFGKTSGFLWLGVVAVRIWRKQSPYRLEGETAFRKH